MEKWIDKVVEYEVGKSPVLFIAPHEGVEITTIKTDEGPQLVRIGERGTGYLAKLAAQHIGGSFIVVHVPRLKADFARDPALLGKGDRFRQNIDGKFKVWFDGHKDTQYAKTLERFHELIQKINPKFIVDVHTMGTSKIDAKLGFGKNRRYIGGSENALRFRDELMKMVDCNLNVLVSKIELTGESEFILNKHSKGRNVMLLELSSTNGFKSEDGVFNPLYEKLIVKLAELTNKWPLQ
ncbi:MAG: hypothetical protein GOV01_02955 [Candidatus Altiarchaeota archaeon]|nr:hypothetical protein [Candidatus Altiarchaeota archaeon]